MEVPRGKFGDADSNFEVVRALERAGELLTQLSKNPVENARTLDEARGQLQHAVNMHGASLSIDMYKHAGEVLVQLLDGLHIALVDSDAPVGRLNDVKKEREAVQRIMLEYDDWAAEMVESKLDQMRVESTKDVRLAPGATCWIWGLQPESLRNGTLCELEKWLDVKKRWKVKVVNMLRTDYEHVAIKPENLTYYGKPIHTEPNFGFITQPANMIVGQCLRFIFPLLSPAREEESQDDYTARATAAITTWHTMLLSENTEWAHALEDLRITHIAKPTRHTGGELSRRIFNTIAALFKDADAEYRNEAAEHVKQWIIALLGVFSHFLPVMAANEHPQGIVWRLREDVTKEASKPSSPASSVVDVADPRDDVVSLASNMDAMSVACSSEAADDEVAEINRMAPVRKRKPKRNGKDKAPASTEKSVHLTRQWTDSKGAKQAEATISLSPDALQYADPDLLRCETTSQLLMLQSIMMKMPKDHKEYKLIEGLVSQMEKGAVRERNSGSADGCGLGDVKTMMSIRLGPGPDTPEKPYQYDPTFQGVQAALDDLAHKCGITGLAGKSVLKLEKVEEETPGRNGPVLVRFSCPLQYKKMVMV